MTVPTPDPKAVRATLKAAAAHARADAEMVADMSAREQAAKAKGGSLNPTTEEETP